MYNPFNREEVKPMKLSEFIIKYREEHDLSQRQFAEICDVSNGYISMIEKEINPKTGLPISVSLPNYVKIAKGMGISVQDLFSSIDDAPVDMTEKLPATEVDGEQDSRKTQLIELFESLPADRQDAVIRQLQEIVRLQKAQDDLLRF